MLDNDKLCEEKANMIRGQSDCNVILNRVVMEGPSEMVEEVTFELKPEWPEGGSHANV